jgi:hypothetical protein
MNGWMNDRLIGELIYGWAYEWMDNEWMDE